MNYQEIQQIVNLPNCKIVIGDSLKKYKVPIEKVLTTNEILYYNQLNTIHKQNQFKIIRGLRTASLGLTEIKYKDYGAPYLIGQNTHISISHKNNYVVFGYSTFKIGIDLELISEKVKNVKSKFLNEQELSDFSNESDEIYTKLWTAKEAIYKTMAPPISFKNDIKLSKDNNGVIIGKTFDNESIININFLNIKNYILCYVLI
jgi:phosphopantetheinyl transferase (holo-ACP synthase)